MAQPKLSDATLRHAVLVEGLKSHQAKKFAPYLVEMERLLRERLTREGITQFQRHRLEAMIADIQAILSGVLGRFTNQLQLDLREFAEYEMQATVRTFEAVGLTVTVPLNGLATHAAFSKPLQAGKGKLLKKFLEDFSANEIEALSGRIRLGVMQGETVAEMVRAIRGTKAAGYADGLLNVTKRNAEAIVRTSVAHVGAVARQETYQANADIFKGELFDASLDQRTCKSCQALDGTLFELGKGPVPPIHISCRCVRVPELSDEFAFLQEGEMRASEQGPIDGRLTYYDWLKKQSPEFQDKVLGKARGKLFRDGGLSAERFARLQLDRNWKPLTLDELKRLEPNAWNQTFGGAALKPMSETDAVALWNKGGVASTAPAFAANSVREYADHGASRYNRVLRGQRGRDSLYGDDLMHMRNIAKALDGSQLSETVTLYRGVGAKAIKSLFENGEIAVGKTFADAGFLSFSLSDKAVRDHVSMLTDKYIFHMVAGSGSRGYMSAVGNTGIATEAEIIRKGGRFKVRSVKKQGDYTYVEIEPND